MSRSGDDSSASPPDPGGTVQGRIEREEFARGHLPEGADPVEARPAATTVLGRPSGDGAGFEVLLLERPATARFAAGAFVFPGGVVDEDDAAEVWETRLPRLSNLPSWGRASCTAAIRELFEETGVLLSDRPVSDPVALARARTDLLAGHIGFDDLARQFDARFTTAPLVYFARWVTPRRLSRRYDALFFLVALDHRDDPVTITDEHRSIVWCTPGDALARFRSGELPMLFPTWKTLEQLEPFSNLEAAGNALAAAVVSPIEPVLDVHGDTVQPRLPGDPGAE